MNQKNNYINKRSLFYQKEKRINDVFFVEKINLFYQINSIFINNMIKEISILTNKNVSLSSYSMKIGFNNDSKNMIQSLTYFNLIEILPCKSKIYTLFSSNMLSIIVDILFGGNNKHVYDKNKNLKMTSTELFVNQKLIEYFQKTYSYAWKKFFAIHINIISITKNQDLKKTKFFLQEKIIIHRFLLKMNKMYFCFCLLTPISILNMFNQNKNLFLKNNILNRTVASKSISIKNISHVKLKIVTQLIDFSISEKDIFTLSVGDVFSIENPKQITAYINNNPVFSGYYAVFYKKSCIIIKQFINVQSTIEENNYHHE